MINRTYDVNRTVKRMIEEEDKKASAIADKAGIRRDTFSRILNCRRPIYADEVIPIARALHKEVNDLFENFSSE